MEINHLPILSNHKRPHVPPCGEKTTLQYQNGAEHFKQVVSQVVKNAMGRTIMKQAKFSEGTTKSKPDSEVADSANACVFLKL